MNTRHYSIFVAVLTLTAVFGCTGSLYDFDQPKDPSIDDVPPGEIQNDVYTDWHDDSDGRSADENGFRVNVDRHRDGVDIEVGERVDVTVGGEGAVEVDVDTKDENDDETGPEQN